MLRSRARLLRLLARPSARRIRLAHHATDERVEMLDLDEYVTGALSAEMRPEWGEEALKAVAIASRTYAMWRMVHPRHRRYDLFAGAADQFWAPPNLADERHVGAVARTRGLYLVGRRAGIATLSPLLTHFHASCGGATDTASAVWGGAGAPARECLPCRDHPQVWSAEIDQHALLRSVGLGVGRRAGPLDIQVGECSASGRILSMRVVSGDDSVTLSGEGFRGALGHSIIRSAVFRWEMTSSHVTFAGSGHGHGVGLCQYGAVSLARRGWPAEAILAHYYSRTDLRRLRETEPRTSPGTRLGAQYRGR